MRCRFFNEREPLLQRKRWDKWENSDTGNTPDIPRYFGATLHLVFFSQRKKVRIHRTSRCWPDSHSNGSLKFIRIYPENDPQSSEVVRKHTSYFLGKKQTLSNGWTYHATCFFTRNNTHLEYVSLNIIIGQFPSLCFIISQGGLASFPDILRYLLFTIFVSNNVRSSFIGSHASISPIVTIFPSLSNHI